MAEPSGATPIAEQFLVGAVADFQQERRVTAHYLDRPFFLSKLHVYKNKPRP